MERRTDMKRNEKFLESQGFETNSCDYYTRRKDYVRLPTRIASFVISSLLLVRCRSFWIVTVCLAVRSTPYDQFLNLNPWSSGHKLNPGRFNWKLSTNWRITESKVRLVNVTTLLLILIIHPLRTPF